MDVLKGAEMSDLSTFLNQARGEGERDSEGTFTLSREQVMEKMASFSFPFHGAWLVRTVQALVASGVRGAIEVKLLKEEVTVTGNHQSNWSPAEIEDAFFNPHLRVSTALDYLRSVLWFLALKERREIWLHLQGAKTVLYWSGTEWRRLDSGQDHTGFQLVVSHFRYDESLPLFGSSPKATHENASLLDVSSRRLYAVPAPFLVDGRRLETFCFPSFTTDKKRGFPVYLGSVASDDQLPTFKVAPGTFTGVQAERVAISEAIDLARRLAGEQESNPVCLAWVVAANATPPDSHDRRNHWTPGRRGSHLCFIADGAEVGRLKLEMPEYHCSAFIFCSAEGLSFDVGGFGLRNDQILRDRLAALASRLKTVAELCPVRVFELESQNSSPQEQVFKAGKVVGEVIRTFLPSFGAAQSFGALLSQPFWNSRSFRDILGAAKTDLPCLESNLKGDAIFRSQRPDLGAAAEHTEESLKDPSVR